MRTLILMFIAAIFIAGAQARAEEHLGSYQARLSSGDHFNSEGERLRSAAAIIRQDRANYHRFGIRDGEDEYDSYFGSIGNRSRLEEMLNAGDASASVKSRIVNGKPLIQVEIYEDYIEVTVY